MEEVDDFTKKCLQSAENRSKKLGISNMSKLPLTESNVKATPLRQNSMKSNVGSPKRSKSTDKKSSMVSPSPSKNGRLALRTFPTEREVSIDAKENADLALEINITTGPNVQVQVQVEEQEIDGDGNVLNTIQSQRKQITATDRNDESEPMPAACIRDSSRNRLERLGALYSNPQDLSSPVHRTEPNFNTEQDREKRTGPQTKPRFTKLNELTKFYNECDDEIKPNSRSQSRDRTDAATAPKTPTKGTDLKSAGSAIGSPQRGATNAPKNTVLNRFAPATASMQKETTKPDDNKNSQTKNMQWDKRIIDSLESQGYKRRDTTNKRLEYNFNYKSREVPEKESPKKVVVTKPPSQPQPQPKLNPQPSLASVVQKDVATKKVDVTRGLVSGRAAIFETNNPARMEGPSASARNQKDPAEMSLKERLALFEKNKGTAPIPKSALGIAPSLKQIMADKKSSENTKQVITTPQQPIVGSILSPSSRGQSSKVNNFNKAVRADSSAAGTGIRQTVAALLANPATIAENRIASETRRLRQQEMNVVLNRFNHNVDEESDEYEAASQAQAQPQPPPPAPPMPDSLFKTNTAGRKCKRLSSEKLEVSPQVRNSLEGMKRIRPNQPKSGHLYPRLSDIESTDTDRTTDAYTDEDNNEQPVLDAYLNTSQDESQDGGEEDSNMDSEDGDSSYLSEPRKNERHVHYADTSADSEDSEMAKYLDEAFDDAEDDDVVGNKYRENTSYKIGTVPSNSFSYERKPSNRQPETIIEDEVPTNYQSTSKFQSPIKSRLTVNPSDDNNSVTLTHTVSFYRRQQGQNVDASPSVRKVIHSKSEYDPSSNEDNTDLESGTETYEHGTHFVETQESQVQDKIRSLLETVAIQQQQIAQASNALNTCASTVEFSGSTESVVAEWKLLVATHCRQAALNEISRLKVERCLRPADAPQECGRLTVKEITLPLRQDYISKLSTEKIPGHNLVCLLKYNEHVLATKTMPTLPGLLSVRFPDILQLDNVYADFKVTIEIYGMTAQREFLPHEIKYHIKNNKKGVIKTPKGKKAESRLIMPPVQSPAGPQAIRSPSFVSYGFAIFSLREAQRNSWTLNQMSNVSPLVGTVHMKVNCALTVNIDHRAFLTMFEDVSGFGAWHRRWCRLHGNVLSYWKYPDDERKPPIGSLDLSSCEQQKITTAPREMCARLNTLMIELKRERYDDDRDTMHTQTMGDYTIVRHLLSADTKEERNEWCAHLNKSLALMRAWGNSQR